MFRDTGDHSSRLSINQTCLNSVTETTRHLAHGVGIRAVNSRASPHYLWQASIVVTRLYTSNCEQVDFCCETALPTTDSVGLRGYYSVQRRIPFAGHH